MLLVTSGYCITQVYYYRGSDRQPANRANQRQRWPVILVDPLSVVSWLSSDTISGGWVLREFPSGPCSYLSLIVTVVFGRDTLRTYETYLHLLQYAWLVIYSNNCVLSILRWLVMTFSSCAWPFQWMPEAETHEVLCAYIQTTTYFIDMGNPEASIIVSIVIWKLRLIDEWATGAI